MWNKLGLKALQVCSLCPVQMFSHNCIMHPSCTYCTYCKYGSTIFARSIHFTMYTHWFFVLNSGLTSAVWYWYCMREDMCVHACTHQECIPIHTGSTHQIWPANAHGNKTKQNNTKSEAMYFPMPATEMHKVKPFSHQLN